MKIIKRNGSEVTFDVAKTRTPSARPTWRCLRRAPQYRARIAASLNVTDECMESGHTVTVEEVQDLVYDQSRPRSRGVACKLLLTAMPRNQKKQHDDDKILLSRVQQ